MDCVISSFSVLHAEKSEMAWSLKSHARLRNKRLIALAYHTTPPIWRAVLNHVRDVSRRKALDCVWASQSLANFIDTRPSQFSACNVESWEWPGNEDGN